MPTTAVRYLLVEGNSDRQLITNLCKRQGIPEPEVQMPVRGGGIHQLLESIPDRVRQPGLEIMGVVVDADSDILARWQALRDRFQDQRKLGTLSYVDFPTAPVLDGWISSTPTQPRVGIWLMPDNQHNGALEEFAISLILPDDQLLPRAEQTLHALETDRLARYAEVNRTKALLHSWLAWQEEPGRPVGQALAYRYLADDTELARRFGAWLRRLFAFSATGMDA